MACFEHKICILVPIVVEAQQCGSHWLFDNHRQCNSVPVLFSHDPPALHANDTTSILIAAYDRFRVTVIKPAIQVVHVRTEVPRNLYFPTQLACHLHPAFVNRQLSPTMADSSSTCAD